MPVFSLNDEATQTTTPTEAKSQEAEPDKTVPQETKTPETNPETTTKEQPEATPTIQLSSPKEEDKPSAQTVETATPATEQKDGLNKQEIALLEQILQSITVQPSEVWWQGEQLEALTPAYLLSANTSEISKAKLRELVTTKLPLKECATRGSWLAIISVLAIDELSELSSSTLKKQQRRCRTATLQRLLSDLGHYGGKIDGRAGVQTWTAIESYNKTTSKKIAAKVTNQAVLELAKTLVAIRQY